MIEEEPNPLWMPRGSGRLLLTIGIVALTGYMMITGQEVPEWWRLLVGGATGGYFVSRQLAPRSITVKEPVELDDVDLLRGNR
jgi:hypothetical protein